MAQFIEDVLYEAAKPKGIESVADTLKSVKSILELGSGTGLGGLFTQVQLKAEKVYMTDICPQSVKLIRENVAHNKGSFKDIECFSSNFLEWGKHDINQD